MELTLASACWEKDYEVILDSSYGNKLFHSNSEITNRMLVINNVNDRNKIQLLLDTNKLVDNYIFAEDRMQEVMDYWFENNYKKDFLDRRNSLRGLISQILKGKKLRFKYNGLWFSIGPLTAIYLCQTEYLLYFTGDAYLCESDNLEWIEKAIKLMEKNSKYIVANPIWNEGIAEVEKEAEYEDGDFFVSSGFSDQCFLLNVKRFRELLKGHLFDEKNKISERLYPVYGGRCFEAVFNAYMRNHDLKRITYKFSHYIHEDFSEEVKSKYLKAGEKSV